MDRSLRRRGPLLPPAAGDNEVRTPPPRLAQTFIHAHSFRGGKPAPPRSAPDSKPGKGRSSGGGGKRVGSVGLEGTGNGSEASQDCGRPPAPADAGGPSQPRRNPKRVRRLSARSAAVLTAAVEEQQEDEVKVMKAREKGKARAEAEPELGEQPDGRVLKLLPDHLAPDLDILVVGINPGLTSSATGHHFAHFSNHFWPALHQSGLTPSRLLPSAGPSLLVQEAPFLRIGLTNLCPRPTRDAAGLKPQDYKAGAPLLIRKVAQCRPAVAVMVGKGIAQIFERATSGSPSTHGFVRIPAGTPLAADEGGLGLQPFAIAGYAESDADAEMEIPTLDGEKKLELSAPPRHVTLCFCVPSTSGRVTTHQLPGKVEWFGKLRALAEAMAKRGAAAVEEGDWIDVEVRVLLPPSRMEALDDEVQAKLSNDKAEATFAEASLADTKNELQIEVLLDEKTSAQAEPSVPRAEAQIRSQIKQETT